MVGRWLKKVGDPIDEFEGLLEVESDKVDTEIPAPAGGTVLEIYIPEGETVSVGTVLALIGKPGEVAGDAPSAAPAAASQPAPEPAAAETPSPAMMPSGNGHSQNGGSEESMPRVSPVVANIAAEHGIDVNAISGTGMGGRVTKKDILAYIEFGPAPAALSAAPAPSTAKTSTAPTDHVHQAPPSVGKPGELIPLSKIGGASPSIWLRASCISRHT